MRKLLMLLGIGFFVCSTPALAQPVVKDPQLVERLSFSAGSNGLSLGAYRQVAKKGLVNLELGYRFFQFEFQQKIKKHDLTTKPDVSTMILGASYDYFPFLKKKEYSKFVRALKVKGGLQYVFYPKYRFTSVPKEGKQWGQTTFTPEEIGTMYTTITTNKLQPFVAAGWDRFFENKKFSFGSELGLLYQGAPKVKMRATYMLEPSAEQAPIVQNNLKGYAFMPYLKLQFHWHLNP